MLFFFLNWPYELVDINYRIHQLVDINYLSLNYQVLPGCWYGGDYVLLHLDMCTLYLRVTSTNNLAFKQFRPRSGQRNAEPDLDANCLAL